MTDRESATITPLTDVKWDATAETALSAEQWRHKHSEVERTFDRDENWWNDARVEAFTAPLRQEIERWCIGIKQYQAWLSEAQRERAIFGARAEQAEAENERLRAALRDACAYTDALCDSVDEVEDASFEKVAELRPNYKRARAALAREEGKD